MLLLLIAVALCLLCRLVLTLTVGISSAVANTFVLFGAAADAAAAVVDVAAAAVAQLVSLVPVPPLHLVSRQSCAQHQCLQRAAAGSVADAIGSLQQHQLLWCFQSATGERGAR